jgi:hypothetical protein
MSTLLLESVITRMYPPNTAFRQWGWVLRERKPVLIEYEAGFGETGQPYMYDVSTGQPLGMTPVDAREDLMGETQ